MAKFLLALALALPALVAAAEFSVPSLTGPVVDDAGVLSERVQQGLASYLRSLHDKGGAQIQVATVKSLEGLSIEEASIKIVDQWQLGRKKEDRGVLLLVAPNEHKVRIEVGRGLEGDLPDVTVSRIIREVIIPDIKAGSIDRGVVDGVRAIAHYTDPQIQTDEEVQPAPTRERGHRSKVGSFLTLLFWLIILLSFLRPGRRRGGGFLWGAALGSLGGGGGGWGGGSSGGSWGGGGGGFSGGGSSGSW